MGVLAPGMVYTEMSHALEAFIACPVSVMPAIGLDWLPSVVPAGLTIVMWTFDQTVRGAADRTPDVPVGLVCNSVGGLIARLYVSGRPFRGSILSGKHHLKQIVTLGTPHCNECRRIRGGMLDWFVGDHAAGAYASPTISYISIAGKSVQGNLDGTIRERHAYGFNHRLSGSGAVCRDVLVPDSSALQRGAQHITLRE